MTSSSSTLASGELFLVLFQLLLRTRQATRGLARPGRVACRPGGGCLPRDRCPWLLVHAMRCRHHKRENNYEGFARALADHFAANKSSLPHLIWRDNSPQHFDLPNGGWPSGSLLAQLVALCVQLEDCSSPRRDWLACSAASFAATPHRHSFTPPCSSCLPGEFPHPDEAGKLLYDKGKGGRCVPMKGVELLPDGTLGGTNVHVAAGGWRNQLTNPIFRAVGMPIHYTWNNTGERAREKEREPARRCSAAAGQALARGLPAASAGSSSATPHTHPASPHPSRLLQSTCTTATRPANAHTGARPARTACGPGRCGGRSSRRASPVNNRTAETASLH